MNVERIGLRYRFTALVGVLSITLFGCASQSSNVDSARGVESRTSGPHRILVAPPEGLSRSGAANFPEDRQADAREFSLDLYRLPDSMPVPQAGADFALFRRQKPVDDNRDAGSYPLDRVGPDIRGLEVLTRSDQILFASRALTPDQLRQVAEVATDDPGSALQGVAHRVAHQDIATVPGIGSLPMAVSRPGSAISYVGTASGPDGVSYQRSVALGAYRGSADDLVVMDWWFGDHNSVLGRSGARQYTFPSFAADAGDYVPDAHLVVWEEDRNIVLVRMVGFDASTETKILSDVSGATNEQWQSATASSAQVPLDAKQQ